MFERRFLSFKDSNKHKFSCDILQSEPRGAHFGFNSLVYIPFRKSWFYRQIQHLVGQMYKWHFFSGISKKSIQWELKYFRNTVFLKNFLQFQRQIYYFSFLFSIYDLIIHVLIKLSNFIRVNLFLCEYIHVKLILFTESFITFRFFFLK